MAFSGATAARPDVFVLRLEGSRPYMSDVLRSEGAVSVAAVQQ